MVACRRQEHGAIRRLDYKDGTAWLHLVGDRRYMPTASLPTSKVHAPRASDAVLDHVYRALLECPELLLQPGHRQHLMARGLMPADLQRNAYRSLPGASRASIGRRLLDQFRAEMLLTVPGVIARDGPHGRYLTLAGRAGILIPVRSAAQLIVALIVRPDVPEPGKKYTWFSSAYYGGRSPGARVHVPAVVQASRRAIVVEGTLKADVVFALSGRSVIGLPGCYVNTEAIDTLKVLEVREALLALDADTVDKPHVARAQAEGLRLLNEAGFDGGLIRWDERRGKGLDDRLLRLRKGAV
jgi:Domain of unknown function (DUF3854)